MPKLTKIVATIGPSCDSLEMIEKMIKAGVDVFRFNFKHNTVKWHNERIKRVNDVAEKMGVPIGTLIDLQGPEIRINMPIDEMLIKAGEKYIFGEESFAKKEPGFSISHPQIISFLKEGQKVLAEDGTYTFIIERSGKKTYLRAKTSGTLKHHKNFNIPGADFPFPVMVERDFDGLKLTQRHKINYVALSFVRSAEDLRTVKKEIAKYKIKAKIVAKIETRKALDNLDEIISESGAVMVARGDLGVEASVQEVPYYQKIIIEKCIEKGIPVITATQMLQSMITSPNPTRAEVSDVANATYDLTDAVMLSGESASGQYPLEAVLMMKKIITFNETRILEDHRKWFKFKIDDTEGVFCNNAYELYLLYRTQKKPISGFIVFSHTGRTVKLISRYRPLVPIFAFVPDKNVYESLSLSFGVTPFVYRQMAKKSAVNKKDIRELIDGLKKKGLVKENSLLIVLHGDFWAIKGKTSTLRLMEA